MPSQELRAEIARSHRIDTHRATIMALFETSLEITIEELRHD